MGCTPQRDIELMSEEEILHLKPSPRPEQAGGKDTEQTKDGEHPPDHAPILSPCANPGGCDFRE
jgi:hypothetical protein